MARHIHRSHCAISSRSAQSQTLQQLFTRSQMLQEIAESTQIPKSKEDALNLLKQNPFTAAK